MDDHEFDQRVRRIVREELAELLADLLPGAVAKKSGRGVAKYPRISREELERRILQELAKAEPLSGPEIARRLGRAGETAVSTMCMLLEGRGLISHEGGGWRRTRGPK